MGKRRPRPAAQGGGEAALVEGASKRVDPSSVVNNAVVIAMVDSYLKSSSVKTTGKAQVLSMYSSCIDVYNGELQGGATPEAARAAVNSHLKTMSPACSKPAEMDVHSMASRFLQMRTRFRS